MGTLHIHTQQSSKTTVPAQWQLMRQLQQNGCGHCHFVRLHWLLFCAMTGCNGSSFRTGLILPHALPAASPQPGNVTWRGFGVAYVCSSLKDLQDLSVTWGTKLDNIIVERSISATNARTHEVLPHLMALQDMSVTQTWRRSVSLSCLSRRSAGMLMVEEVRFPVPRLLQNKSPVEITDK